MNFKQTIFSSKIKFLLFLLMMNAVYLFGQNSQQKIKDLTKKVTSLKGKEKVQTLIELASFEEKEKLRTQTFKHLNEALQLCEKANFRKQEAEIHLLFGQYKSVVDTARALVHFQKSLAIFEQQKDSLSMANSYLEIGNMYDKVKDYPKALTAQLQSLKIRKLLKAESIDIGLFNTAVAYNNIKNYQKANDLFQEALAIFKRKNKKKYTTSTLMALGALQILIDNPFGAFEYLSEAEGMAKELDLTAKSEIELLRAKIHFQGRDYSQAAFHAKKALKKAVESHSLLQMQKSNHLLYRIYKGKGSFAPALGYQEKNLALQDSLHFQKLEMMSKIYVAEKLEVQADYLRKASKIQEKMLDGIQTGNRNLLFFIAGFVVLIILFLIGVFIFNKRAIIIQGKENTIIGLKSGEKKLENELKSQEKEIKVQRQRIQLLMSEKKKLAKPKKKEKFQNEDAENINSANERFFAIIAHELRNPITAFQELSSEVLNYLELGETEKIAAFFDKAEKGINALNLSLDNLLNFTSLQSGAFESKPKHLKLSELTETTFQLFDKSIGIKKLEIKNEISSNLKVKVDQNAIHIILRNLISNAVKFSNQGGLISLKAMKENNFVKISITDTGIGIPENQLPTLFDLKKANASKNGIGLGLVLVKEFVAQNGGKIWAESSLGKGTTFHFTLPH